MAGSMTYGLTDFFSETTIPGCSYACEIGDACSLTLSLSGPEVTFAGTFPWNIIADASVISGYNKQVCMRCTSND